MYFLGIKIEFWIGFGFLVFDTKSCYITQADLQLAIPLASASPVLRMQVCTSIPRWSFHFILGFYYS
jgi:hypothetical protein